MEGMKVEGDAERGPCKLIHDKEVGPVLLTGDQAPAVPADGSEALASYSYRAAALGLKDVDFVRAHEQARAEGGVKRLEGMLRMAPRDGAPGRGAARLRGAKVAPSALRGGRRPRSQRTIATICACASGSSGGIGSPSTP